MLVKYYDWIGIQTGNHTLFHYHSKNQTPKYKQIFHFFLKKKGQRRYGPIVSEKAGITRLKKGYHSRKFQLRRKYSRFQ